MNKFSNGQKVYVVGEMIRMLRKQKPFPAVVCGAVETPLGVYYTILIEDYVDVRPENRIWLSEEQFNKEVWKK